MAFPEHSGVLNAPVDTTGGFSSGPTEAERSQQTLTPDDPLLELQQSSFHPLAPLISDTQIDFDRRPATDYPPIAGGQETKNPSKLPKQPDLDRWPQTGGYPPGSDEHRRFRARELGLDEDSSWGKLGEFLNQQDLLAIAKALEFSEQQIERISWYSILFEGVLGLVGNEPIEKIIERIREVRAT